MKFTVAAFLATAALIDAALLEEEVQKIDITNVNILPVVELEELSCETVRCAWPATCAMVPATLDEVVIRLPDAEVKLEEAVKYEEVAKLREVVKYDQLEPVSKLDLEQVYQIKLQPVCECPTATEGCPKDLNQVCGTDGVTYANQCLLQAAACQQQMVIAKEELTDLRDLKADDFLQEAVKEKEDAMLVEDLMLVEKEDLMLVDQVQMVNEVDHQYQISRVLGIAHEGACKEVVATKEPPSEEPSEEPTVTANLGGGGGGEEEEDVNVTVMDDDDDTTGTEAPTDSAACPTGEFRCPNASCAKTFAECSKNEKVEETDLTGSASATAPTVLGAAIVAVFAALRN